MVSDDELLELSHEERELRTAAALPKTEGPEENFEEANVLGPELLEFA